MYAYCILILLYLLHVTHECIKLYIPEIHVKMTLKGDRTGTMGKSHSVEKFWKKRILILKYFLTLNYIWIWAPRHYLSRIRRYSARKRYIIKISFCWKSLEKFIGTYVFFDSEQHLNGHQSSSAYGWKKTWHIIGVIVAALEGCILFIFSASALVSIQMLFSVKK